jgi:ABC-2 type transport system permease protein
MRIITIMLKDLKQILQEKRSLLFLVAMPVVFTLFMGFAYGSGTQNAAEADPRLAVAWVNQDGPAVLSEKLYEMLADSDTMRVEEMDETAAGEALRKGELAGVLVIPAGFSQSVLAGAPGQLSLLVDPASASSQTLYQLMRQPVTQLISSVTIAALNADDLAAQGLLSAADRPAEFDLAFQSALERWDQTGNAGRIQTEMAVAEPAAEAFGGNPYNQASPGMLMMFAVMGLVNSAQILLHERKDGTLSRMLTTSLSPSAAIAGHFLAMFVLTFLQQFLLVAFGQLLLGVDYLREPLGILSVMLTLSMAIAGIGLFIGAVAKEEQQVALFSLISMFILSALGGAWFPLEGVGQAFAAIGRLTPTAWAMTGFQNILIRGLGAGSALLPAGILVLYAAAFYALATWRLKKSM